MNMKKTIAAIAAGSVAVSAMATTVSAVEAKTLNYNLVEYLEANPSVGSAKLTANFSGIAIKPNTQIKVLVDAPNSSGKDLVTIGGRYVDNNKSIDNMYFTVDTEKANYNKVGADILYRTNGWAADWAATHNKTIALDVKEVANASSYELQSDISTSAVVTNGTTTVVTGAGTTATGTITVSKDKFIENNLPAGNYTLVTSDGVSWAVVGDYSFPVSVTGATAPNADGTGPVDTIEVTWTPTATADVVSLVNLTVTYDATGLSYRELKELNADISSGLVYINVVDSNGNTVLGDVKGTMAAVERYRMPFRTNLSGNADIISYLESARLTADADYDKSTSRHAYVNVKAVLNDAIENYDGVTFTFNTASTGVKYVVTNGRDSIGNVNVVAGPFGNDWKGDGLRQVQSVLDNYKFSNGAYDEGYQVQAVYSSDWDAIHTYEAFGEHTYDWRYAPEATGFTGYDWGGTNLFAGALIVNERLTMSLSNTEYFDWTKTSVSFDWEAIMDNAATTNNYATYIQTLKLATSNLWFWDSMDVVLTVGEADDVSADAGVTSDDDTLDDDDDIGADDDDDVAPADDDDDDDVPAPVVDEPVAAPVVSNPPTGNASVALAVIPVALAAAAIVAKKRG